MNEIIKNYPETTDKNNFEIITTDKGDFVFKKDKKNTTIESHKTAQAASYISKLLHLENNVIQYQAHKSSCDQKIDGTISKFIKNNNEQKIVKIENLDWKNMSDENKNKLLYDLKKIAIYDYIIANTDRNTNNLLIDINNFHAYAIDQDESFDNYNLKKFKNIEKIISNQIISYLDIKDEVIVRVYQKQPIKDDFINKIMEIFLNQKSIRNDLVNYGISELEINKMFERVKQVLEAISNKQIYQTNLTFR